MRISGNLVAGPLAVAAFAVTGFAAVASPGEARAEMIPAIATDEADSLYRVAGELYANGEFRQAIPLFLRVVDLDPRHANAYALLGGSYFQLGDHERAIEAFEEALRLDEGIKLAYLGLVASNSLTERLEDAREWVRRMVPILTGDERVRYLTMLSNEFPELEIADI